MFIAMNRFSISEGREEEFESLWRERESYLDQVPGFVRFHLLRGPTLESMTLFVSHSQWQSRQHFEDWTRSEAFRQAHGSARSPAGVVLGHPTLEVFEDVDLS